jgi:class 3 adenylate cyclase
MAIKVVEMQHHALRGGATASAAERLEDFYRDVLGIGGANFGGAAADAIEPHVKIAVADLEAARHELDRLGVIYRLRNATSATPRITLRDPSGNLLELQQWGSYRRATARGIDGLQNAGYTRIWSAVMFADMRGFTRISEHLRADQVAPLLNEYFELLTDITLDFDGRVFHLAGDGMMAGFGVPEQRADSPCQAVKAAHEMLRQFDDMAIDWKNRLGVQTGLGIGINAGEVIAGHVGSASYMHYTIVGDTVNVASRLSQRARAGEALFSSEVMRVMQRHQVDLEVAALPPLQLRGRDAPVEIYCLPSSERLAC